jgi:hypothetical protein
MKKSTMSFKQQLDKINTCGIRCVKKQYVAELIAVALYN